MLSITVNRHSIRMDIARPIEKVVSWIRRGFELCDSQYVVGRLIKRHDVKDKAIQEV